MDLRLAQRLNENERYQFLNGVTEVELRPNQLRNYVALKRIGDPVIPSYNVFVDGEWKGCSSDRQGAEWQAEGALGHGSIVLVAWGGAGKKIKLFIDEEDRDGE